MYFPKIRTAAYLAGMLTLLSAAPPAGGQCTKDTDCRAPRVCERGVCKDPGHRLENLCAYAGGVQENFVPGVSSVEARERLQEIGRALLLENLPEIKTGPVDTASAQIYANQRLIVYNPAFINRLEAEGGKWPVMFVFAHELGHHVMAHVWYSGGPTTHEREFQADAIATKVLARLNADQAATVRALSMQVATADGEHPPMAERKARVVAEFRKAQTEERRAAADLRLEVERQSCTGGGKRWTGTECVEACGPDQRWDGAECADRCAASERWDRGRGRCVDRCDDDEEWNSRRERCEDRCDDGEEWNGRRCVDRCDDDEEWDGYECVPLGYESGWWTNPCGCWGFVQIGTRRRNRDCASGSEMAVACNGYCMGGGVQWGTRCE